MKTFLIYGSYGYTGQLIAERAVQQGLKPILAKRDETRLRAQEQSLNLEYRAFSLNDTPALYASLRDVGAFYIVPGLSCTPSVKWRKLAWSRAAI